MNRLGPTRAGLFAIELLIAVGVFAFCAAVCTGLLVKAEAMSRESEVLNRAVNEGRNLCECYKAADGSLDRAAALAGGSLEQEALVLRGDGFTLRLGAEEGEAQGGCPVGSLVACSAGGETLFTWTVAARGAAP